MIDEILQFHDKGDDILEELCELLGVDALIIDFEHYDNTSIEINHDSPQEIFDFLTNQIRQETDVIRKKCLAFILAKIIEKTHLIPSITIDFLEDDSESPYVLFRLANIFYQVSDFQTRCIEIFRQIIINKENHMDMRFEATENLNHLARIGDCPTLIPILLEILALDEYHFEDSYFAGHDFGATIFPDDDCGFDPNYSEYWIIDIKKSVIDSLSFFPEQFDKIVDPLISFMTEEYQIKEYIDSVIRILRVYIDIVPHAFDLLLEKIGFQYEFFFGAKITIDTKNRGILYTD